MMLPRAFFFDFDGTLVDSNRIKREAFFYVTRNIPGSRTVLEKIFQDQPETSRFEILKRIQHECSGKGVGLISADRLIQRYGEITRTLIDRAPEIPGTHDLLSALHRDSVLLFICSMTPENDLVQLVNRRTWGSLFSSVRGIPPSKLEAVRLLQKEFELDSQECFFVGDSANDRAVAKLTCKKFFFVTERENISATDGESFVRDMADLHTALYY